MKDIWPVEIPTPEILKGFPLETFGDLALPVVSTWNIQLYQSQDRERLNLFIMD